MLEKSCYPFAAHGSTYSNNILFVPSFSIKHKDDKPLLEWQLETLVRGFFDCELLLDFYSV